MIRVEDWGRMEYEEALARQRAIFEGVMEGGEGAIIFCEHEPVFTLGRNGDEGNILAAHEMRRRGAKVVRTDRGGDVTFHGPGQLVVYPVLDLGRLGLGLREYIGLLEQAVIDTLAEFGISGVRSDKGAGVWVSEDERRGGKICAIGVRASRGVVMHGLALNVSTDLEWFRMINPCGMAGEPVARMEAEMDEVKSVLEDKLMERLAIKY